MNKFYRHPEVLEVIKKLEDEEKDKNQKSTNLKILNKTLEILQKDPKWKSWMSPNDCKFYDSENKFGYLHFYSSDEGVYFQVMREVDDFIYIPVLEEKYEGQSIKQLISMAERVGKK